MHSCIEQRQNTKLSKKYEEINTDCDGPVAKGFSVYNAQLCWYNTTHFYTRKVGIEVDIIRTMTVREFLIIQQSTNKV